MSEIRKTEEGEKSRIGSELDTELVIVGTRLTRLDGVLHVFEDLAGELHARDGAHVIGGIIRKAELVSIGQSSELEEGIIGEDFG